MNIGNLNSLNPVNTVMDNLQSSALKETKANSASKSADEAKTRKTAEDFVAVFMGQMFKSMDEGNSCEGFGQGGSTEKMWREMCFEEYGKAAAVTPGNGLTDMIYRSLQQKSAVAAYGA